MYNRYIPQPDGSFRRKQVSDMQANSAKPMTPKSPPNQQPQRQEPVPAAVSNRPRNGQPSPAYTPSGTPPIHTPVCAGRVVFSSASAEGFLHGGFDRCSASAADGRRLPERSEFRTADIGTVPVSVKIRCFASNELI